MRYIEIRRHTDNESSRLGRSNSELRALRLLEEFLDEVPEAQPLLGDREEGPQHRDDRRRGRERCQSAGQLPAPERPLADRIAEEERNPHFHELAADERRAEHRAHHAEPPDRGPHAVCSPCTSSS